MSSAAATPPAVPPAERPLAVTIIGWVWILYAAVKLLGGVWGLLMWRLGGVHDFLAKPGLPATPAIGRLENIFGGFGILVSAQIVFASAVLVAAAALLRLRPWARTGIEVLSWLGLCYVALFGVGWVWAWRRTAFDVSRQRFLGLSLALGVVVVLSLAFVSMIRALRSAEVRRAFRGGSA